MKARRTVARFVSPIALPKSSQSRGGTEKRARGVLCLPLLGRLSSTSLTLWGGYPRGKQTAL